MKSPVSMSYIVVMVLLAVAATVLSYVIPNPAFNLAALLLGVYGLHLVSLRVVLRKYAPAGLVSKTAPLDLREIREQLDLERRELENRKAQLQQRIEAAEQQWELLRGMIRDRVGEGPQLPDSVVAAAGTGLVGKGASPAGSNDDTHVPPRIHGRW